MYVDAPKPAALLPDTLSAFYKREKRRNLLGEESESSGVGIGSVCVQSFGENQIAVIADLLELADVCVSSINARLPFRKSRWSSQLLQNTRWQVEHSRWESRTLPPQAAQELEASEGAGKRGEGRAGRVERKCLLSTAVEE